MMKWRTLSEKKIKLPGNRTPVSAVAGENSTTEPTMLANVRKITLNIIYNIKLHIVTYTADKTLTVIIR